MDLNGDEEYYNCVFEGRPSNYCIGEIERNESFVYDMCNYDLLIGNSSGYCTTRRLIVIQNEMKQIVVNI